MSSAPERYYRPAGTVPAVGAASMLALGCLGALVFSFIYSLILNYVPYDKIMFLGAMGVGFGVGGFVRGGALLTGVTSRLFSAIAAILCGLLGCYLTWVWDIWMIFQWDLQALSFDPLHVANTLVFFNDQGGIWENSPTGIWLWLLWLVEMLMITGIAVGISVIEFRPYCHDCRKWTEALPSKCVLPRTETAELRASLEEERYDVLDQLAQGDVDPGSHFELSLMKCPNCTESDYLTVAEVDVSVNKKGEASVLRKEVIRRLYVPEEVVDQVAAIAIRQQGPALRDLDFGASPESGSEVAENEAS